MRTEPIGVKRLFPEMDPGREGIPQLTLPGSRTREKGFPLLFAQNLLLSLPPHPPLRVPTLLVPCAGFVGIFADERETPPALEQALLDTLAGIRRPEAGCVFYLGQNLAQAPAGWARAHGLSLLGAGAGYEDTISVEANLRRSGGSVLPAWLFRFLPLEERLSSPAKDLPLVERRWLSLACALAARPRLLLLHRPLEGLPPLPEQALLERLVRINLEEGIAFCFTAASGSLAQAAAASLYRIGSGLLLAA